MIVVCYIYSPYLCDMFIRQTKKKNSAAGKTFYQYMLIQAARIEGKSRQRNILYLGSEKLLDDPYVRKRIGRMLEDKILGTQSVVSYEPTVQETQLVNKYYEKYLLKYADSSTENFDRPPLEQQADYREVDINSMSHSDVRTVGGEHLCESILDRLGLRDFLSGQGWHTDKVSLALISIIARALFSSSEYKTMQYLKESSSLNELYGVCADSYTHRDLYKISDSLYESKDKLDAYLYNKVCRLFDLEDSLVIYDLSNSHFEGRKAQSNRAQYGRNKQKRNDCKQVTYTGVINEAGFIRHSRIYDGNQSEPGTFKDMLDGLADRVANQPDKQHHTVVMDAAIATQENIAEVKQRGWDYVCVAREQINDYQVYKDEANNYELTDNRGHKINLSVFTPEGYDDRWMYVESEQKRIKEQSMDDKLSERFTEDLQQAKAALSKKNGTKKTVKVYERIGRLKERHSRISAKYRIDIVDDGKGTVTDISWERKPDDSGKSTDKGVYFIRTSYENPSEKQLWNIYNTIREVEATFRCLKSDLNIRPVYHHNDQRIESHIYLTLLAYQLVNTIRHLLKSNGIHHCWSNIVRIMNTQTIQTTELKNRSNDGKTRTTKLRKVAKPIDKVREIYVAAKVTSSIPSRVQSVVYH